MADIPQKVVDHAGGHMRVLGPPASGKTSLLVERFRRLEKESVPGAVAAITYTREHRDWLTTELLAKNSARFGRAPVLTYHALAMEIVGKAPALGGRVAGEMEESVLLHRVMRRVARDLSSGYRNAVLSASFRHTVLDVLHVLMQNGITRDHSEAMLVASTSSRVRDLILIYDAYLGELDSQGFTTWYNVAWTAAELVARHPQLDPLVGIEFLLIDDFQDVDPGQYALLRALAPPAGKISVNVFGDPTGARFRDRGTTDRYLAEVFPREYGPFDSELSAGCGNERSLGPVVEALLSESNASADYSAGDSGVDVRLVVVDDEGAEASYVAERASELVESGRYDPGDIAIAARAKQQYQSVLVRSFRDRGLLLDTGGRRQHPFEYFVASLLRHLDDPGAEAAKVAVSTSPYLGALRSVYEEETRSESDDESSLEDIKTEILSRVEVEGAFDMESLFNRWLRPVLDRCSTATDTESLLSFLGRVSDEWRSYAEITEKSRGRRSLSEFAAVSRALSTGDRGTPSRRDRVGFYSCHELSSRRFPVVFLVGCSELLFPALPAPVEYVPFDAVEKLLRRIVVDRPVELYQARSDEDFLRDEYALMLASLTKARKELVLTAPKSHRGKVTPAPTRILKSIPQDFWEPPTGRFESPFLRFASAVSATQRAPKAEMGEELRFRGHPVSELWQRARVSHRTLTPSPKPLSPTSIQAFTFCQRRYFYERILGVRKAGIPALAFGTLFHDLMTALSKDNRTHEELRAAVESKRLDEAIDKVIDASEEYRRESEMIRGAARFHLKKMAQRALELDSLRSDAYRIQSVERGVGFQYGDWTFGGRADRIDESSGGRVVVDYKTGSLYKTGKTVRKKALPGFDKPGERLWQIPLYCKGAQQEGSNTALFCYYVVQPGGDHFVAGLYVGEEDAVKSLSRFDENVKKGFAHITPQELEACLDEAAEVAKEVFSQRSEYQRTDDKDRCSRCDFKRVCERTM